MSRSCCRKSPNRATTKPNPIRASPVRIHARKNSGRDLPAPAIVSGLLLPASAECPVKLHETLVFGAARLCEREFGGKEGPLAVQDFEISGGASLVTHVGQANGFLQVLDGGLLANADLMKFLIADQRIGYVPKRVLNRLPVNDQSLLMLRLG